MCWFLGLKWHYKRCKQKDNLVPALFSNLSIFDQVFPWVNLGRLDRRNCLACCWHSFSAWACGYREQVVLSTLIGSRAVSIWLKVEGDSQCFAQVGVCNQDGVHWPGQGAGSVLQPTVCKWMAHAQAAEKSVGDSYGSLWVATLSNRGCVAVLGIQGHTDNSKKAKIIEMQYGYELNLKSLTSMQDIWCCLM